jgi:hypothetical protein
MITQLEIYTLALAPQTILFLAYLIKTIFHKSKSTKIYCMRCMIIKLCKK